MTLSLAATALRRLGRLAAPVALLALLQLACALRLLPRTWYVQPASCGGQGQPACDALAFPVSPR